MDEDDGSWHSEADPETEISEAKYDANNCEPAGIAMGAEKDTMKEIKKTTWKKMTRIQIHTWQMHVLLGQLLFLLILHQLPFLKAPMTRHQ